MKLASIALGLALAASLPACTLQAPEPAQGFLGQVYVYEAGKLVAGFPVAHFDTRTSCVDAVKAAVDQLRSKAPAPFSVAGACYPVPDAPPVSATARPARPAQAQSSDGSQTL